MPDIMHLSRIHAPRERVYDAVTTAEGIRNWWRCDTDLESTIGGSGEFRFHEGRGVTTVRVDELEPPGRVGWTTLAANAP